MATERAVAPPHRPSRARLVAGIAAHTALLTLMPFVVGGVTGFYAEVSQVGATLGALVRFASVLLLPVLVAQLAGIAVKVRRERDAARSEGDRSTDALLDAVHRHVRVLTDKGLGMFVGGLVAVSLSLVFKFAELGVIAVLGLVTLYLLVAAAVVLSTFVVTRFEQRLATRRGTIGREFAPALVEAGDSVEERFHFERVPVPAGFNLRLHQELPARLATETRHVVGPAASLQRITLSRALRRTPRGDYHIGPAEIAYTDLFGLTRVAVAHSAGARLKVLPRLLPIGLGDSPKSHSPEEGALSALRRLPTDDHLRFRDYVPGDDTRRIHWKLSLKVGRLQVRIPETVTITPRKVRLVLDNHLPAGLDAGDESDLVLGDALDHLVEVWLSLARALLERGEAVTLVMPTGEEPPFEETECRRGAQARWREVGSRARWQRRTDLHDAIPAYERGAFVVVVTARVSPLPPLAPPQGAWITWVFLPLADEIPGPVADPHAVAGHARLDALVLRFPAGSDENAITVAHRRTQARRRLELARAAMLHRASNHHEAELRARAEPFYRVRRAGPAYVLDAR